MCAHQFTPNLPSTNDSTDTIVIQLGANWIHNCDSSVNPMYKLAQKLEVGLHPTSPDEEPGDDVCLFDANDVDESSGCFRRVSVNRYKSMLARWEWVKENIPEVDNLDDNDCKLSLLEAFRAAVRSSEDPSLPFGPCCEADWRSLNWCFDRLSIDCASPIQNISTKWYSEIDSTGSHGGEVLVQGGYFQLLEHLATEFELDIRCEHVVESVVTNSVDDTVTVTCKNGSVFVTDACLVTLPVGVLVSGVYCEMLLVLNIL